jgi:hypothetical protein
MGQSAKVPNASLFVHLFLKYDVAPSSLRPVQPEHFTQGFLIDVF